MAEMFLFNNTALSVGGGICIDGATSSFANRTVCENCILAGNKATRGGAVSIELSGSATRSFVDEERGLPAEDPKSRFLNPSLVNCKLIGNFAAYGGGVFYSPAYFPTVTLSNVLLRENTASDFGGGVYIAALTSGDLMDEAWMNNGTFEENHALYGGYNVAWRSVSSSRNPQDFCVNCSFLVSPSDIVLGYSDERGFATAPVYSTFEGECPSPMTLNQPQFEIDIRLYDAFGTPVNGSLLQRNDYTALMTFFGDDCVLYSPNGTVSDFPRESGVASFPSLSLQARNGSLCNLRFFVKSSPIISNIAPINCPIQLQDCPASNRIVKGETFDSCEYRTFGLLLTASD